MIGLIAVISAHNLFPVIDLIATHDSDLIATHVSGLIATPPLYFTPDILKEYNYKYIRLKF